MKSNLDIAGPKLVEADSAPMAMVRGVLPSLRWLVVFTALYVLLDVVSSRALNADTLPLFWNLPLGLCLAAAYRDAKQAALFIFLAAFFAQIIHEPHATVLYAGWIGVLVLIKTIVPVVAGKELAKFIGLDIKGARWAPALLFAIPVSFASSLFHAGSLILGDQSLQELYWLGVARLWIGDLAGIFVIAPLVILFSDRSTMRLSFRSLLIWEVACQALFAFGLGWFVFVENGQNVREYFYILSLPIIWITLRHGSKGAVLVNLALLCILSLYLWSHQSDPTQAEQLPTRMLVLVITALTLGVTVDEGRSVARRLRAREHELSRNLKAGETSELAGMLAHELSHPLGAISNYAAAVKYALEQQPVNDLQLVEIVGRLRQEVRRAGETIQRLREFYRSGSLRFEQVEIGQIVREAILLLANKIDTAEVNVRVSSLQGPVYATGDGIQLHSVVHNLLVNAIDELKLQSSGPKIVSISIKSDQSKVILAVDDSGRGVPQDIVNQIFEPMITTKKDGLGLGLSMSKSIVNAHGGKIALEQSSLGGARFIVTLPLHRINEE